MTSRRSLAAFAPAQRPRTRRPRTSSLEARFDQAWDLLRPYHCPLPVAEVQFAPPRRWRFDRAFVAEKVAVELDGGMFARGGGRHNRAAGLTADAAKYNAAQLAGWIVLRFTTLDFRNPLKIVETVAAALRLRGMT